MKIAGFEEQIRSLGAVSGDVLYMRASLSKIGLPRPEIETVFLQAVRNVLGSSGTIIVPAFVKQYPRWKRNIPVSDKDTPSNAGALAQLILSLPGAIRSEHPTHSFAGYGPRAREILEGHIGDRACFEPMRSIAEMNALMLLVGCVEESPGFSTVHLAQFDLGLSQQHYLKYVSHVRVRDKSGGESFFHPIESPGCSKQFGRFYEVYSEQTAGLIGKASSMSVRAKSALNIEKSVLERNPRFTICDNGKCLSCSLRGYNKSSIPKYFLSRIQRIFE
ncbi:MULTISPECIES: AAC(3) family N-acetyltransferase [Mesorhizobium]|uniref:Aminoglycoside N(3)-acetyltransferase n=1 Tax=Mesorhizobium denitrificans TaxID=2294114 RepID=A0A371XG40_9HYPH|nr:MULTISPECIES: AAC(3) family N-acetyltransferase [Mesorhizobium]RFC68202.1 aminoglycoside N(3)-acetyltransferase [Mesorhizobium denitrificans]